MNKVAATVQPRSKEMNDEKPLDQRAREAEQYAFDFPPVVQPQPETTSRRPEDYVCIGNCDICRRCNNSNNRDWAMKLYLASSLHTREEVQQYFRAAYQARFGRDMDVSSDVQAYIEKGETPPYVEWYVSRTQQEGGDQVLTARK